MVDIDSLRSAINLLDKYIDNDRIPRHCTFGNHEQRVYKFEENIPEIAGMMKKELHDTYLLRNWKISPYGAFKNVGGGSLHSLPFKYYG